MSGCTAGIRTGPATAGAAGARTSAAGPSATGARMNAAGAGTGAPTAGGPAGSGAAVRSTGLRPAAASPAVAVGASATQRQENEVNAVQLPTDQKARFEFASGVMVLQVLLVTVGMFIG